MTLRLAGQDYSVVQGLDGLGWLRNIDVSSSSPTLTLTQRGAGPVLKLATPSGTLIEVPGSGALSWLVGGALEAGKYQVGRNTESTNLLQYNVPAGSVHRFTANGSSIARFVDGGPHETWYNWQWQQGNGITAGQYQIGRNNDATNHFQFNVPAGSYFQFSVNGVDYLTIGASDATFGMPLRLSNIRFSSSVAASGENANYAVFRNNDATNRMVVNAPANSPVALTVGGSNLLVVDQSAGANRVGFFGATPAVQQTSGANLTNNVTSGGTDDTIANYTDLTTYANDAAAIRSDIYQLARKLKQVNDSLRAYGVLT